MEGVGAVHGPEHLRHQFMHVHNHSGAQESSQDGAKDQRVWQRINLNHKEGLEDLKDGYEEEA